MIRPHSPSQTPADKPAHSGEGGGAWSSPWQLDEEWHDAPPRKTRPRIAEEEIKPIAKEKAEPAPALKPAVAATTQAPPPQAAPARRVVLARESQSSSLLTLIILSMGLLAFVFIAWLYVEDQAPGFDEDLLPQQLIDQVATIQTPEKLRKFLDSMAPFENGDIQGRPPWLWDTPTLARIVQSNGAALDNLRDLLEDADWHPTHAAWHAVDPCSDPRWQQALLLKQVEAAYLSRRLQEEEAFTAAIDLAELGWRLEPIRAWPSCYRRALEAQTLAAQTLADLLRQTKLPEATLRQYQRQFSVCQPPVELLEKAMNAFYVHEKKLIFGPQSGELLDTMPGGVQLQRPGRLFFKPNETLQLFATAFRQLKDEVKAPLAHTSAVRLKEGPTEDNSFQPNSAGRAYFNQHMKDYTTLPSLLGLVRARGNLIITLFAVRRCIAEKKTVPATLEELRTQRYLLDLPPDPYSGAPLQYNLARGLIWSVGNDLQSRGGAPTESPMNDATEPTVETGIAVAAVVK